MTPEGWPRDSWIVFNPRAWRAVQEQRLPPRLFLMTLASLPFAIEDARMEALLMQPAAEERAAEHEAENEAW
jgi:hypothetical protein